MMLTPRLLAVAESVPRGARILDVGTDHAKLPVYLLLHGAVQSAAASDVKPGPLARAKATVSRFGLTGRVPLFLSDGLKDIPSGLADTVVIAGMGGLLIFSILSGAGADGYDRFVLQPMRAVPELRRLLTENGFVIIDERLAAEGDKLYNILCVSHGPSTLNEFFIGEKLLSGRDPLLPLWLARQADKTRQILSGLPDGAKRGEFSRRLALLEKTIDEVKRY